MLPLKQILFILFYVTGLISSSAQSIADQGYLSRKQMQEDLDSLSNTLRRYHPGINRYDSSYDVYTVIENLKMNSPDSMAAPVFYTRVAEIVAGIGCVHTRSKPAQKWDSYYDEKALYLPFNLNKIGGYYYVSENFDTTRYLKTGDRVVKIEGVSLSGIQDILNTIISSDAQIPERKEATFRKGFYWYYGMYFGVCKVYFEIQIQRGNDNLIIRVPAVNRKHILEMRKRNKKMEVPIMEGRWVRDNTFYLKVNSFAIKDNRASKYDFAKMLDSLYRMNRADTAKKFILDLRGNPGGLSEMGALLCLYFMPEAFTYCQSLELKTNQFPSDVKIAPLPSYPGFPEGILEKDGHYYWTRHPALGKFVPTENAYHGDLIVLCNGASTSTTVEVISNLSERPNTLFAGSNPGGAFVGGNSGLELELVLPQSGIRVTVPLVAYHIRTINPYSSFNLEVDDLQFEDPKGEQDIPLQNLLETIREETGR